MIVLCDTPGCNTIHAVTRPIGRLDSCPRCGAWAGQCVDVTEDVYRAIEAEEAEERWRVVDLDSPDLDPPA